MNGRCQNGGCQRLGTVEVTIPGLGRRHLCHFCEQALTSYFGDLKVKPVVIRPLERFVPFGGAA